MDCSGIGSDVFGHRMDGVVRINNLDTDTETVIGVTPPNDVLS